MSIFMFFWTFKKILCLIIKCFVYVYLLAFIDPNYWYFRYRRMGAQKKGKKTASESINARLALVMKSGNLYVHTWFNYGKTRTTTSFKSEALTWKDKGTLTLEECQKWISRFLLQKYKQNCNLSCKTAYIHDAV